MKDVYIKNISSYLPNHAVDNESIEDYIGLIDDKESRAKRIILNRNGINTRYYALNKDQKNTHSNAELCFEAIKGLKINEKEWEDINLLCSGTSSPSQIVPSHASMLHGLLDKNLEIYSNAGVCASSIQALKTAFLSLKLEEGKKAIVTGSEVPSQYLKANRYSKEIEKLKLIEEQPYINFEKDFLRFMLSDGASALLLSNEEDDAQFKIHWIEQKSYANEQEVCMLSGGTLENGDYQSFLDIDSNNWMSSSVFSLKQNIKLLQDNILKYGARFVREVVDKRQLNLNSISYFLPHLSSMFFKDNLYSEMKNLGVDIAMQKWYTNLPEVGNVGSASGFLMLDGLQKSKTLKSGEMILVAVPESARFTYSMILLEKM